MKLLAYAVLGLLLLQVALATPTAKEYPKPYEAVITEIPGGYAVAASRTGNIAQASFTTGGTGNEVFRFRRNCPVIGTLDVTYNSGNSSQKSFRVSRCDDLLRLVPGEFPQDSGRKKFFYKARFYGESAYVTGTVQNSDYSAEDAMLEALRYRVNEAKTCVANVEKRNEEDPFVTAVFGQPINGCVKEFDVLVGGGNFNFDVTDVKKGTCRNRDGENYLVRIHPARAGLEYTLCVPAAGEQAAEEAAETAGTALDNLYDEWFEVTSKTGYWTLQPRSRFTDFNLNGEYVLTDDEGEQVLASAKTPLCEDPDGFFVHYCTRDNYVEVDADCELLAEVTGVEEGRDPLPYTQAVIAPVDPEVTESHFNLLCPAEAELVEPPAALCAQSTIEQPEPCKAGQDCAFTFTVKQTNEAGCSLPKLCAIGFVPGRGEPPYNPGGNDNQAFRWLIDCSRLDGLEKRVTFPQTFENMRVYVYPFRDAVMKKLGDKPGGFDAARGDDGHRSGRYLWSLPISYTMLDSGKAADVKFDGQAPKPVDVVTDNDDGSASGGGDDSPPEPPALTGLDEEEKEALATDGELTIDDFTIWKLENENLQEELPLGERASMVHSLFLLDDRYRTVRGGDATRWIADPGRETVYCVQKARSSASGLANDCGAYILYEEDAVGDLQYAVQDNVLSLLAPGAQRIITHHRGDLLAPEQFAYWSVSEPGEGAVTALSFADGTLPSNVCFFGRQNRLITEFKGHTDMKLDWLSSPDRYYVNETPSGFVYCTEPELVKLSEDPYLAFIDEYVLIHDSRLKSATYQEKFETGAVGRGTFEIDTLGATSDDNPYPSPHFQSFQTLGLDDEVAATLVMLEKPENGFEKRFFTMQAGTAWDANWFVTQYEDNRWKVKYAVPKEFDLGPSAGADRRFTVEYDDGEALFSEDEDTLRLIFYARPLLTLRWGQQSRINHGEESGIAADALVELESLFTGKKGFTVINTDDAFRNDEYLLETLTGTGDHDALKETFRSARMIIQSKKPIFAPVGQPLDVQTYGACCAAELSDDEASEKCGQVTLETNHEKRVLACGEIPECNYWWYIKRSDCWPDPNYSEDEGLFSGATIPEIGDEEFDLEAWCAEEHESLILKWSGDELADVCQPGRMFTQINKKLVEGPDGELYQILLASSPHLTVVPYDGDLGVSSSFLGDQGLLDSRYATASDWYEAIRNPPSEGLDPRVIDVRVTEHCNAGKLDFSDGAVCFENADGPVAEVRYAVVTSIAGPDKGEFFSLRFHVTDESVQPGQDTQLRLFLEPETAPQ